MSLKIPWQILNESICTFVYTFFASVWRVEWLSLIVIGHQQSVWKGKRFFLEGERLYNLLNFKDWIRCKWYQPAISIKVQFKSNKNLGLNSFGVGLSGSSINEFYFVKNLFCFHPIVPSMKTGSMVSLSGNAFMLGEKLNMYLKFYLRWFIIV